MLRYLMLLSLVVWVGGIIFFAAGVAPVVFSVLPTHHLAGLVVNRSLGLLHWMGIASGVLFLITSVAYSGRSSAANPRNLLVLSMIVLTLVSMFVVTTKMSNLNASMGVIDDVQASDPRRVEFNQLHQWSTRLEVAVLVLGLAVLYLTGNAINQRP